MPEHPAFVPDTNVVVSRLIRRSSVAAQAFDLAVALYVPLYSAETLQEMETTIARPKFDRYISTIERVAFLRMFRKISVHVSNPVAIQACRDPKDDIFLSVAVAGNAALILTGDDDLISLHPFAGIQILTPRQLLDRHR